MRGSDLSAAIRHLRRDRGFTLLAVAALGLGLTGTIAAFGLGSAVVLAPLPYPEAGRLWVPHLTLKVPGQAAPVRSQFSYADFVAFRKTQAIFDRVAGYVGSRLPLTGARGPERIAVEFVTPEYFAVLGARPERGRLFAAASAASDEAAGDTRSLLLSDRLWRRRFAADPGIVGSRIEILHQTFTVAGVLSAGFEGLTDDAELWLPLAALPAVWDYPEVLKSREFHSIRVVALARSGVSSGDVRGAVSAAGRGLAASSSGAVGGAGAETLAVSRRDPELRRILALLLIAASVLLLIACTNVAGLQLARSASRRRELAVRMALGATRWRVVRQLLAESGLLALMGGASGLAGAWVLIRGLVAVAPRTLPSWGMSGADLRNLLGAGVGPPVLLFAIAVTFAVTLLAGLVPALEASGSDAAQALGEGGASLPGGRGHRRQVGRRALVVLQTATSVALLAAAGLLLAGLRDLVKIDPGFHAPSVLALRIESAAIYDEKRAPLFHQRLLAEIGRLPGVSAAALGSCVPFAACGLGTTLGSVDGKAVPAALSPALGRQFVSPGYFRTVGIPLVAGRDFAASDRRGAPRVVIVSRSVARRFWPQGSALGHHLYSTADMAEKEQAEVVGVVGDVRFRSLTDPPAGDIYVADYQNGAAWGVLFVQAEEARHRLVPALRQVLGNVDRDLPFLEIGTIGEQLSRASSRSRYSTALMSAIAVGAFFLTLLGVYGVVAQGVDDRRRELALRVALGATRGGILSLVVRQGLQPVFLGLALGVPLAEACGGWMKAIVYGAGGVSPGIYWMVLGLVVVAATTACFFPARRAARVDPGASLRRQ
ncbi:MAG: ADOP family duplicated permease [Acidobacteriota bacterium]|nr:ADOP family duplicated permease [Acidobacteriota bacterium]